MTGLAIRAADGTTRTIAGDLVLMAPRPEPVVTLASQAGLALAFEPRLAEWIPVAGSADVVVTGHMTGLTDDDLIAAGAVLAGRVAAGRSVTPTAPPTTTTRTASAAAFAALPEPVATVLPVRTQSRSSASART